MVGRDEIPNNSWALERSGSVAKMSEPTPLGNETLFLIAGNSPTLPVRLEASS